MNILFIYIFGGITFYISLWLWKSYQNLLTERKYDKWVARVTLAFPFWPIFLVALIVVRFFSTMWLLIKLSEFKKNKNNFG